MRGVLAFALLAAACSFRANPARGDGSGSDAARPIDAPPDARVDGAPGAAKLKVITVTTNKIGNGGVLGRFPMWFTVDDPDLAARATASGADIYFTKTDGTPLAFERQRWTKSSGHLEAWVLVDLDPSTTNKLELRYGDPGPATSPDPAAVFANGFLSVWHFEDSLATPTVVDTVGNEPGTASGFALTQQVPAKLGGGFSFDGAATQVAFTNALLGAGSSTISAWVKLPNTGYRGFASIVTLGDTTNDHARFLHARYNSGLGYGYYGDDVTNQPDASDNNFHLIHLVYTSSGTQSQLYKDGATAGGASQPQGNVATSGTTGVIGNSPAGFTPGGNSSNAIAGILDEVRIATVVRSQQWITTEFNNQSQPAMFYSVGAEQLAP